MKTVLRILNLVILAACGVATALLFTTNTFSLYANVGLKVQIFNDLVDKVASGYIETKAPSEILGVDVIHLPLSLNMDFTDVNVAMSGDKDKISNLVIKDNVDTVAEILYEPINIITEYTVRTSLAKIIKEEIAKQIQNAMTDSAVSSGSTPEEIMDEVGMNDLYFRDFALDLYKAADEEGATVGSFTSVIFWHIDEAIKKADDYADGQIVDSNKFGDDQKQQITNNFVNVFKQIKLLDENASSEDNQPLNRISQIVYVHLSDFLKTSLIDNGYSEAEVAKQSGEDLITYSKRLSKLYVAAIIPDNAYNIIGYACLGIFIGLIVFAAIWSILFVITLIRTFSKGKPWTIFGPWFWIFGAFEVVVGIALTVVSKYFLDKFPIPLDSMGLSSLKVAIRTSALIPSMIFLGMIIFAIIYAILRHPVKKEYKMSRNQGGKAR